jgi:uncharacterized membrane protein
MPKFYIADDDNSTISQRYLLLCIFTDTTVLLKVSKMTSSMPRRILVILFLLKVATVSGWSASFPISRVTSRRTGFLKLLNSEGGSSLSNGARLSSLAAIPTPLIGASDTWGNIAALTGTATVSQVLGRTTSIGRLLGPPVTAMAMTFLLASIGVLNPGGTAAAKSLQLLSLQLATPMILLGADLRDCFSRCGPLLGSFLVASTATIIACTVGWYFSGNMLQAALGKDGLSIAAALLAKNVGGGINYIAVCRSLSVSPQAVAAGLCVDNIFALIYFPATSALAAGLPDVSSSTKQEADEQADQKSMQPPSINIQHVSTVLFLASLLLWMGERIGGTLGALPASTLLAVMFASWVPNQWMSPLQPAADVLGTVCLYLFFATAGAPGVLVAESVRASLLPLTLFLTCLYSIHGAILWACHKLWGKTIASFLPQRLLVSSSAAIGGPATAAALVQANDWESLLVPSLLVGNIGYAMATFCGLAYYAILR